MNAETHSLNARNSWFECSIPHVRTGKHGMAGYTGCFIDRLAKLKYEDHKPDCGLDIFNYNNHLSVG